MNTHGGAPVAAAHEPAVLIDGLRVVRDGRPVLEVPAFELPAGGQAVVVGPSGSGKTTLLAVLAGMLAFDAGRVRVAGEDLAALASRGPSALDRFRATRIGLVPQQPMLFGVLDATGNLLAAQHFAGRPTDRAAAHAVLAALGLHGLDDRRPGSLSRGQQQRVAIARALINRPALILADEPTANLDDAHTAQVLSLLAAQAGARGASLLIATHDARVRERFERVLVLPPR